MKTLYFDCFSGISGDMTIGALIDLGVDFEYLKAEIGKLPLGGFTLRSSRVVRANIGASKFDVLIDGDPDGAHQAHDPYAPDSPGSGDHESHPHAHDAHSHPHSDPGQTGHSHAAGHGPHRRASEIMGMIRSSVLSRGVRERATAIFEKLAISEGRVHDVPPEDVAFHEVGAIDSIVDIVGAAIGLEALEADRFLCSSINVGGGFIQCQHGIYPVPAPATSYILTGAPVYSKHVETELVTPTGAAILAATVDAFGPLEPLKIDRVGYGAGTKDFGAFPNCLRLFLGTGAAVPDAAPSGRETVLLIEANIDDMSAEELAWVSEKLLSSGALDVLTVPAQMKKGRPGHILQVMGHPDQEASLTGLIFAETTTIGLRTQLVARRVLERESVEVATRFGKIRVKIARQNGRILNVSPEYEDCARIARQSGEPFHTVREDAVRSYRENAAGDRAGDHG